MLANPLRRLYDIIIRKLDIIRSFRVETKKNDDYFVKEVAVAMRPSISKEQFYKAFRSSPAPVFISTVVDGIYIEASDSGLRLLGYSREEIIGHTVTELSLWINPEERAATLLKLSSQEVIYDKQIRLRTKSGIIKEILWSCQIIKLNKERVVLSFLYDVTESKKAADELKESRRRLADIIDFLPDATFVIDLQGTVIAWNRAIEEMTGVKAADILGKGKYEYSLPFYGTRRPIMIDLVLKHDRKLERGYLAILERQKDLLIVENWVPCLKGRKAFLWGKASPLYDSAGNIIGAIESIRDITDRKLAEDVIKKKGVELEKKTAELEDLNAALRVLLKQRENDKNELENRITTNIKMLVLPQLEEVKRALKGRKAIANVEILETNLKTVCSPFIQKLSAKYFNLTNREIKIATLIKEEKTSKEIAALLNISESAINAHRFRIRQKLNISKQHNLLSFLSKMA